MRALVIYCHPRRGSFTEAVRDVVLEKLRRSGPRCGCAISTPRASTRS
jgi:putative NADPH-quinone reductase